MRLFDEVLLDEIRGGLSLPGLVARSFRGDRDDQLTVTVVLGRLHEVYELLLQLAGGRAIRTAADDQVAAFLLDDEPVGYSVSLWRVSEGVTLIAATPPFTDERWRRVERWLVSLEPQIASVFLDESDFEGICEALAGVARVEVSRLTARVLADGSSYTRGWPEDRVFERPTFDQALAEVTPFALVRSLSLHVGERLSLHLRRAAGATFYSGEFSLFHDVVIGGLTTAADRRHELLANRERRSPSMPATALSLELASPTLAQVDTQEALISHLTRQRGLGIAVLHRNPYLHLAVTDYIDGSNFDIFVLSEARLTIFPGYRATIGSLARTTDALSDRFAAVSVQEITAAQPPTREELFTTG